MTNNPGPSPTPPSPPLPTPATMMALQGLPRTPPSPSTPVQGGAGGEVSLPPAPPGQMCLRVNGRDHFIAIGQYRSLLDALRGLGFDIPHFCYHPGLEPDGNCRMCTVNVMDLRGGKPLQSPNLADQPWTMFPKPVISCRQPLDPRGMAVETETPAVLAARRWIMEFMLINHPLDCPVCDKAGECFLQDYSYAHGPAGSRFGESKIEKPPKDLGPTIRLWTDRCILCRRCTRFLQEVTGTGELYIEKRGDRSEIAAAPGRPLDNPLMGNVVDLCPVGALMDKDQMYSYRAWYLRRTSSLCPACSKGCNIQVQAVKQFVRRLVPRANPDVNGWWICDRGRKDFPYINSTARLTGARVDGKIREIREAAFEAGQRLAEIARRDAQAVAGLASAWMTLEEMYLFRSLFHQALGVRQVAWWAQSPGDEVVFPKFKIEGDRNPNRRGADLIFGGLSEEGQEALLAKVQAGACQALFVCSGMPHFEPSARWLQALAQVPLLIVQDLKEGPLTERAAIVLPASSFAEKDGVFMNVQGRLQRLRPAIDPLAEGWDDLGVLQEVNRGAGAPSFQELRSPLSAAMIFQALAQEEPFLKGLTHGALGESGVGEGGGGPKA